MMNSSNTNIDLNTVVSGKMHSMTLGQLLDAFMDLLMSNDPRKDQFEEIRRSDEIIPRFVKTEWYSQQLLRMLQTFPCSRMIIRKDGQKIFETDNIDMMYIGLSYYRAFFEDSTNTGFCWHSPANPDGNFYEADFSWC